MDKSGLKHTLRFIRAAALFACVLSAAPRVAHADAGVLIPTNFVSESAPDQSVLSLRDMVVDIDIVDSQARVRVLQVFENHTNRVLEGKYIFQLPGGAVISDFAVWDGRVRIPGVIMEKKRGKALYQEIVSRMIDPGLLTQDEDDDRNAFTVKVAPIPAYGTKRLELEYRLNLDVSGLRTYFTFPLKPSMYLEQTAKRLRIDLKVSSGQMIRAFKTHSDAMPIKFSVKTPFEVEGSFEARDFALTENFSFEFTRKVKNIAVDFMAHRKTDLTDEPVPLFVKEVRRNDKDGYFMVSPLFNLRGAPGGGAKRAPASYVVLLDTSLSMRWSKLDRAYEALRYFLADLSGQDEFRLLLFNDRVTGPRGGFLKATPKNVEKALKFVRGSYLTGGTDIEEAFARALKEADLRKGRAALIMITDGRPTAGAVGYSRLSDAIAKANKKNIPVYIFGIGGDTNTTLLGRIVEKADGWFDWAGDADDIVFKLRAFFGAIQRGFIRGVGLEVGAVAKPNRVYPAKNLKCANGSALYFVGRYSAPAKGVPLTVSGDFGGRRIKKIRRVSFPEKSHSNAHVKRLWARARVDFLLEKIDFEGEREEWIEEIIELSRQYNFVTLYTSFLAAPRALLRPRVIKPGDPVLRVRADESIVSVIVVFPFNLVKRLTYLKGEGVWETRFLAPVWMNDGTYECALVLRDRDGNVYREKKSFVIDSRAPSVKARLDGRRHRPGATVIIRARTDADTRRLTAVAPGLPPVEVTWSPVDKECVGRLELPPDYPEGSFPLKLAAEDFAHNISTAELRLEVAR